MAAQDELFQLIKSLTPSEKRYFKVNASKGGDAKSNYMQLFEAMDSQKDEYDEQKLKAKHSKKAFVKYLSAEKKQLREQIMKHMRAYRSDSTVDNKINELLQDEAFYRDKGLKPLREKAIEKAKELATKYERFHLLQEILEKEIAYVEEFEEKSLTEQVLKLITELKQLSVNQQTFLNLWSKNKEIFAAYRSGDDIKDSVFKHRMDAAIAEVELLQSTTINSYRLQRAFFRAHSNYHNVFRNREESYNHTLREYELFQSKPHFIKEEPFNYKICLANLISRAQAAGKSKEFLTFIDELKSLPVSSFNEDGEVFQNIYFLEHLHYINVGEFEMAEALIPEIKKGLEKYARKINKARLRTFQYNIMVMYFVMHRFEEASDWAEKILEDRVDMKQELITVTRILLPIIHFELGHNDLVDPLTRSAYRYLKGKKRLHDFEKLMVVYLKSMPFSPNPSEFKHNVQSLDIELKTLFNAQPKNKIMGMEEVQLWVQSKLSGSLMSALLNEHI